MFWHFGASILNHFRRLQLALFVLLLGTLGALAEGRRALVVGINDYANVPSLEKAINDARAIAEAFRTAGFEVQLVEGPDQISFLEAVAKFSASVDPGDEAVVYYAGHGIEIDGRNYLLPSDVPTSEAGQEIVLTNRSVAVEDLVDALQSRGARISLLILDACRNNPFPRSGTRSIGGTRGLTSAPKAEGMFILYSAGEGETALDRLSNNDPDPNSVFTRTLIPLIAEPGLPLREMSRRVRSEVRQLAKTVNHAQFPAVYDQLDGDFSFTAASEERAVVALDTCAAARADWVLVERSTSVKVLEGFIAAYPACAVQVALAQARLEEIGEPASPTELWSTERKACVSEAAKAKDLQGVSRLDPALGLKACVLAMKDDPDNPGLIAALDKLRSADAAKRVLAWTLETPPTYYLSMIKSASLKREVELELERRAAAFEAGPCAGAAAAWKATDWTDLAAMEAFLDRFPDCGPSSIAAEGQISDQKGKIAEAELRLSRRQIAQIALTLYASAGRTFVVGQSGRTLSLDMIDRTLIADFATARGLAKPGERVRHLDRPIADALLATDFVPFAATEPSAIARQVSGRWVSSLTDRTCESQTAAASLSDTMVPRIPRLRAIAFTAETGDGLRWEMVEPNQFDTTRDIEAVVGGKVFKVSVGDANTIRPPLFDGGPTLDSAMSSAMRHSLDIVFKGTNVLTGEPLTVVYSLDGFTAAFQRMATLCNRSALLSWIE